MEIIDYLRKLRADFRFFLAEIWRQAGLPTPTRVQYDIAHFYQHGPKRRGAKAYRHAGKTWIAVAYMLWRLFRNVDERILFLSQSLGHSADSSHLAKGWIMLAPFLRHLKPATSMQEFSRKRTADIRFDVSGAKPARVPSVRACGITGQITGNRATLILPDDIETLENSLTREQRYRTQERFGEMEQVAGPHNDIIVLGTPHHEDTAYDYLADERGYTIRSWPARYPTAQQNVRFLAPMLREDLAAGRAKPGDPTDPERFDDEALIAHELRSGPTTWLMQMMLVSGLDASLRYPLKLSNLIVFDLHRDKAPVSIAWGQTTNTGSTEITTIPSPGLQADAYHAPAMVDQQWQPYQGTKAFIDPAGTGKDSMAWSIVGFLNGYLFAKHVGAVQGGAKIENLTIIAKSLREHDARELYIEENWGGDMLIRLIRPVLESLFVERGDKKYPNGWACYVEGVHSSLQKEVKIINALEPVMAAHRLVVDRSVALNRNLGSQIARIRNERKCLEHEDELESLACAVLEWKDYLDVNPARQAEKAHEEAAEKTLTEWQRKARGIGKKPAWMKW